MAFFRYDNVFRKHRKTGLYVRFYVFQKIAEQI